MAPHSSTLAWKIPWTEEPGRLQSMGSRRVGHDWVTSLSCIGEGNGNPLQYSCLENPRDGRALWAAIYGVAQSRTRLKWLSSSSSSSSIVPIFAWNVPLVSLIFFKRSLAFSVLLFSSIPLHWSLKKAFLSLLAVLWNSAFRWVYLSFPPLPLASLLSQLFVRLLQTTILPFTCLFLGDGLDHCLLYNEMNLRP